MIALDDINTDKGCLQHLLLAEALSPEATSPVTYNFVQIQIVFRAMKSVITNRKGLGNNSLFCSVGATTFIDYICAPVSTSGCQAKQFNGFSKNSQGKVIVSGGVLAIINKAIGIANDNSDSRHAMYQKHINEVIFVSQNNVADPYINISDVIGGSSVIKGVYGWKTSGSTSPGGSYVAIPQTVPPLVHPNGNIQGTQFYTIKDDSVSIVQDQPFA